MGVICSSDFIKKDLKKKTTTTNPEGIYKNEVEKNNDELIYPKEFNKNEIKLAQMYLKSLDQELAQSFLDKTAAQIINRKKTHKAIRNPVGYLSWLCNEYEKGNFYLTSLYLKHQELRNREEVTERAVEKKKQELIQAAKNRKTAPGNKNEVETRAEELPFTDEEKKQSKKQRWGNLPRSLRKQTGINEERANAR